MAIPLALDYFRPTVRVFHMAKTWPTPNQGDLLMHLCVVLLWLGLLFVAGQEAKKPTAKFELVMRNTRGGAFVDWAKPN